MPKSDTQYTRTGPEETKLKKDFEARYGCQIESLGGSFLISYSLQFQGHLDDEARQALERRDYNRRRRIKAITAAPTIYTCDTTFAHGMKTILTRGIYIKSGMAMKDFLVYEFKEDFIAFLKEKI